ncbi:MAG: hypothetical protein ABIN67_04280 [Ferruginibacter sp.]
MRFIKQGLLCRPDAAQGLPTHMAALHPCANWGLILLLEVALRQSLLPLQINSLLNFKNIFLVMNILNKCSLLGVQFIACIILFNCSSCVNNTAKTDQFLNTIIDDSVRYNKKIFNDEYQKLNFQTHDSSNISNLRISILELSDYIDHTNTDLKKIKSDDSETNNVRNIFIDNHIGDSIYYKLDNIFTLANKSANSLPVKKYISYEASLSLGNHDIESWKNSIFGANIPMSVIIFLKGIQSEIYKIGAIVFTDK